MSINTDVCDDLQLFSSSIDTQWTLDSENYMQPRRQWIVISNGGCLQACDVMACHCRCDLSVFLGDEYMFGGLQ